ncbi:MAG: hypothetical protein LAT81_10500 [Oceanicaulis sp.]|nr:hypothetical protein [Oceanicaulis sp.]
MIELGLEPEMANTMFDVVRSAPLPNVDDLLELQREQVQHDEQFHKEIVRLSAAERIKHIVLHLAKYHCHLQLNWGDEAARNRVITDSLIMCLSGLSMLNRHVADTWAQLTDEDIALLDRASSGKDDVAFNRAYAKFLVSGAAAAEKLDHIESHDYRGAFVLCFSGVSNLCHTYLKNTVNLNPSLTVRERLLEVKKKSIFFGN